MATGTKTPIEPGVIARAVAGVRYAITGKGPEWFGPGQPLQPVAQEAAQGRAFDFPVNTNATVTPRGTEPVTFTQMRQLADGYDLLRLIIETRKDQVASLKWSIKPKKEGAQPDARCQAISDFLQFPDQEHDWATWLRMVLEEMLVIDAATIYPRQTVGGDLYALELIDGGSIKRVLDQAGRTPMPPDVAYQQILKGMAAVDYSRDELIYKPRNPRANRVYGYSPVEQIIMTVNIALRRQLHQLQYYTEGNVPEALIGVPPEWNPDQIKNFQDYWDALLEGNTAARRHAKFVPGGMNVTLTKGTELKDDFDDWLARVVCYAFSVEPTPFVKGANRATAQSSRAQALSEGLVPTMQWVCSLMDLVIAKRFGAADLRFDFDQADDVDALTQAQIDQIYVTVKVKTPNEVRDGLGLHPMTPDQIEELKALQPPPPAPPGGAPGEPPPDDKANPKSRQQNSVKPTEKAEVVATTYHTHHHINVEAPEITMPAITMPSIKVEGSHITVQPPEVLVDVGATTINATFDPPPAAETKKLTKTITATRGADGSIVGKVTEE